MQRGRKIILRENTGKLGTVTYFFRIDPPGIIDKENILPVIASNCPQCSFVAEDKIDSCTRLRGWGPCAGMTEGVGMTRYSIGIKEPAIKTCEQARRLNIVAVPATAKRTLWGAGKRLNVS